MVSRKTRLMSALLAILMLVSMFTAFVLPVSAETNTVGGIYSVTGLVNKTDAVNITDYDDNTSATEFKVTNRAGMDKLATLVNGGTSLDNVTIWQMADIDMGWSEFAGVGRKDKPFKGTFDGNGFTIDNLFIQLDQDGVGLFSWVYGAIVRNVGVSGGVTVGFGWTGGVVGVAQGGTTVANCWNAGTVIAGYSTSAGSAGVVARMDGANNYVYNCYNVGLLVGLGYKMSGVVGWLNNAKAGVVNSYNAGEIVADMISNNAYDKTGDYEPHTLAAYTSVLCKNFTSANGGATSNNYYIKGRGKLGSVKELSAANPGLLISASTGADATSAINAVTDDATGLEASAIDTMAAKLNGGASTPESLGHVDGYYVSYENTTDAGYPVLTYRENSAEGTIVVQRVAKTTENVNGAKTWEDASPLFKQLVDCRLGALKGENTLLAELKITNADDLWLLSLISFGIDFKSIFNGVGFAGKIVFTNNVDMSKRTVATGVEMYPISRGAKFNGTIDGKDYTISNLKIDQTVSSTYPRTGLIYYANGATVQNLGIASGTVRISGNYNGSFEPYVGSFFGLADGSTTIRRCWNAATVACEVVKKSGDSNSSASGIGRMHNGTTMDSCFNIGLVKNTQCASASGLNDFGQNAAHLYNSFAYCDIQHNGKTFGYLIRQRTWKSGSNLPYQQGETWPHANTWAVGGSLKFNNTSGATSHPSVEEESYWLGASAYSSGELAWTLNDGYVNGYNAGNGNQPYYTVEGGKTVFGTAENQTRKVILQKKYSDKVIEETYAYVNAGTSYNYPEFEGYTVSGMPEGYDATAKTFTMPQTDVTLVYSGTEVAAAKTIVDLYDQYEEGYEASFDLFAAEQQTKLTAAYNAAKSVADGTVTDAADIAAAITTVATNYVAPADLQMKNEYPYYPKASQYTDYVSIYDKDANGRLHYRVSTADEWRNLVKNGFYSSVIMDAYPQYENTKIKGGSGDDNTKITGDGDYVVILHITNDIDFNNEVMKHAAFGSNLVIDGHNHVFKNVAVEKNFDENTKETSDGYGVALITDSWNCIIQNFGLEGGYVKATGATDAKIYASSFVGLQNGASNQYYNCWSTAKVSNEVSGKNTAASGLANLGRGDSNVKLYNCYYGGEVSCTDGDEYVVYYTGRGNGKTGDGYLCLDKWQNKNVYGVGNVTLTNATQGITAEEMSALILAEGAVENGELANALNTGNQAVSAKYPVESVIWSVSNGVTTFGTAAPVQVTFTVNCENLTYTPATTGVESVTFWTGNDGKVLATAEQKTTLNAAADWGNAWDAVYTAETTNTVTGKPYPKHDDTHLTTLVANDNGTHDVVCAYKTADGVACQEVIQAGVTCEYTASYKCVDENAKPTEAKHQGVCACGNKGEAVLCNPKVTEEKDATVAEAGYKKHECTLCDYEYTETLPALFGLALAAEVEGYSEEEVVLEVQLKNNTGLGGAVFEVIYNKTELELTKAELLLEAAPGVGLLKGETIEDGNKVTVVYDYVSTGNYTGADFLKLTFKVQDIAAECTSTVNVKVTDASTFDGEDVVIQPLDAQVKLYDIKLGDITGDKKVDIKDAVLMLRYVNDEPLDQLKAICPNLNTKAADVNKSGEVDLDDVIMVLQYLSGVIDKI